MSYKDFLFIPSRATPSQPIAVYTADMVSTPERRELHYHDCFSIIYILKPHVRFCMENQEEIIPQAGEFVFLLPRTVHALRSDNPQGYHIDIYIWEDFFYQNILPRLIDNPKFMSFFSTHLLPDAAQPHKVISTVSEPVLVELLKFMCREQQIYDSLTPQVLSSQLITLLAYLSRIHQETSDKTHYHHAKADQIVTYIESHFLTVTLNEVAWHFHYSPNYISQSLRTETGKSFTEWVQLFRTSFAENLLKNTTLPVATISVSCGFENVKYFYRFFKKQTGMTVMEYREKYSGTKE